MECRLKPCPCATHVGHDCLAQVLRRYFCRLLHFPWLQNGAEREKQKCLSQTHGMIPGMGRKRTPGLMRLTRTRVTVKIHGGLLLRMTFQLMVTACWWRIHGLIHLDAALRLASDLAPIAKEASQYDTNGACPKRLGRVLSSNCKRKHCARPGCKAGVISHQEVCSFMEKWVKLPLPDRNHLLRCNYYQDNNVIARDAEAVKETVEWHMCGSAICFQRFCEILGSSQRTVRKMISGQPDLRLSKSGFGSQSRAAVQTAKCDHFSGHSMRQLLSQCQRRPKCTPRQNHWAVIQEFRCPGVQGFRRET